jgi:hypothetical protein
MGTPRKKPRKFRVGNMILSEDEIFESGRDLTGSMMATAHQEFTARLGDILEELDIEDREHAETIRFRLSTSLFAGRPQCFECGHWHGDSTCDAFEGRIPVEIVLSRFDHRNAHPQDNGLRYFYKGENEEDACDPFTERWKREIYEQVNARRITAGKKPI